MYVYGPSSLANYPASVWEHRAFPITAVSVWARRETATVNVPGRPWQSAVFLRGLRIFIFKSKPPGSRVCWVYSCSGNRRLVDCVFGVKRCRSVGVYGRHNLAQCACKLRKNLMLSHAHLHLHPFEPRGSLTVQYAVVRTRFDGVNDVWSSVEVPHSCGITLACWVSLFTRYSWGRRVHVSRPGRPADSLRQTHLTFKR